jgi:hypothetical protein
MKYLFQVFIDQAPIECVPALIPSDIVKLSMATQKFKFVYSKCEAIVPSILSTIQFSYSHPILTNPILLLS